MSNAGGVSASLTAYDESALCASAFRYSKVLVYCVRIQNYIMIIWLVVLRPRDLF